MNTLVFENEAERQFWVDRYNYFENTKQKHPEWCADDKLLKFRERNKQMAKKKKFISF